MSLVPTAYTEATLATMMHTVLSDVAADLGFVDPDSYSEPIIDVELALGVDDVADETDIAKIRAFARVAAFKHAITAASARYDSADGTQSLKRSQMAAQLREALTLAEAEAAAFPAANTSYEVTVSRVDRPLDPYRYLEDELRV